VALKRHAEEHEGPLTTPLSVSQMTCPQFGELSTLLQEVGAQIGSLDLKNSRNIGDSNGITFTLGYGTWSNLPRNAAPVHCSALQRRGRKVRLIAQRALPVQNGATVQSYCNTPLLIRTQEAECAAVPDVRG
jgi:hypothetical protein